MEKECFKVGDAVEVTENNGSLYKQGATGNIIEVDDYGRLLVQFFAGEFSKKKKAYKATAGGQWWVKSAEVKVVKEVCMKDGYGLDISKKVSTGWAVEVDGELGSYIFDTRKEARAERTWYERGGKIASVRRVEIKVLDHKV